MMDFRWAEVLIVVGAIQGVDFTFGNFGLIEVLIIAAVILGVTSVLGFLLKNLVGRRKK